MFDLIGRSQAHQPMAVVVIGAAQHQGHALVLLQPVDQGVHVFGFAWIGDCIDHQRNEARLTVVERSRHRIGMIVLSCNRQDALARNATDARIRSERP